MEKPRTRPSGATRAEEDRDARVHAGADTTAGDDDEHAPKEVDPDVAENYEEMIDRGAEQRGEGRIP